MKLIEALDAAIMLKNNEIDEDKKFVRWLQRQRDTVLYKDDLRKQFPNMPKERISDLATEMNPASFTAEEHDQYTVIFRGLTEFEGDANQ